VTVTDAGRQLVTGSRIRRTPVEVRMLGALEVRRSDGSPVPPTDFRTAKTRHLLRLLALQEGAPVRVSLLIELLWPDATETRGRSSLRTAAAQIRRTLASDHLVRRGDALSLEDADVDVIEFQHLADRTRRAFAVGDRRGGLSAATCATALYRGAVADDEPDLDALAQMRDRLAMMHADVRLRAGIASLELGDAAAAVDWAAPVADADPTTERACRLLMVAHARLGEVARALRAYERCRRALADELGSDPARRTRWLYEQLLFGESELGVDGI
jgi:SARP family transcriptional regulator, regulator of embCAB operon